MAKRRARAPVTHADAVDLGWQVGRLRTGLEWLRGTDSQRTSANLSAFDFAGKGLRFRAGQMLESPVGEDLTEALAVLAGERNASVGSRVLALDDVEVALVEVLGSTERSVSAGYELGRLLGGIGTDIPASPTRREMLRKRFDHGFLAEVSTLADDMAEALPFARRAALLDALARWCARVVAPAGTSANGVEADLSRREAQSWRDLLLERPSLFELLLPAPYGISSTPRTASGSAPAPSAASATVLAPIRFPSDVPAPAPIVLQPPSEGRGPAQRRRWRSRTIEVVGVLLLASGATLAARAWVVQTFDITSGSMTPTLRTGDRVLVNKLTGPVRRGDVIAFRRVATDHLSPGVADLVKRVIGLPGDRISSRKDQVLIDGKPLAEPWLPKLNGTCSEAQLGIVAQRVPVGDYFVMGDCRGNSLDSRYFGDVPATHVIGKVVAVVWRSGHPWFHWF